MEKHWPLRPVMEILITWNFWNDGCAWSQFTFALAAEQGNLENMRWLLENGCSWDIDTPPAAATYGSLENLKFLYQNGCYWNANTLSCAAKTGNLANMKFLKKKGCPWDEYTLLCRWTGKSWKHAMAQEESLFLGWIYILCCSQPWLSTDHCVAERGRLSWEFSLILKFLSVVRRFQIVSFAIFRSCIIWYYCVCVFLEFFW